jgi:hypothetical protein
MAEKSSLAAEAYEVVHIQHVEPRRDVRAFGRTSLVQTVKIFA